MHMFVGPRVQTHWVLGSWTGHASRWAAHEMRSKACPLTRNCAFSPVLHFWWWNRVGCWCNVFLLHVLEDLSCHSKCFPAFCTFNSIGSPPNHSKTGWLRSSWFTRHENAANSVGPNVKVRSPNTLTLHHLTLSFLDPWNPLKSCQFKWLNPGTPPYVQHPFNWACLFCSSLSLSWGCHKLTQEALYL